MSETERPRTSHERDQSRNPDQPDHASNGYDGLNRLTEEIDPLGHSLTLAYNGANRLTSQTDRLGRRRDYVYDASGRLLTETWKNSDGTTANVLTHTYDANGNELTAQDSHGVYTLVYDDANQVTSVQELFGLTLTMTYDAAGNRTRVQDSLGGVTTSVYNAVHALTQRAFGGVSQIPLRVDENYNARNQVTTLTRYSDLAGTTKVGEQLTSYDSAGRTTTINQRDGSGTSLINLTYTYDSVGRVSTQVRNGSTTTYLYDATNQLTDDGVVSYSYDANGNRTMAGYQTGPGNQLTNDGVNTYTYDNEGNLSKKSKGVADETWTFSYDQRNQLIGVDERATDGGTLLMRATYTYDVFGNRVQKDVWDGSTTTTTRYGVDGWKHPVDGFNQAYPLKGLENFDVWAELDGSNALVMRRLFGDGIDQPLARIDGAGTASWYHQDRLGSVVGITDNSGTLIDNIAYDGFLNVTTESSPANGDDIRGTGRLRDAETGLQRHGARMYDPRTGRWIEQDPDRFDAGDANLMRYIENATIQFVDPSGFQLVMRGKKARDNLLNLLSSGWKDPNGRGTLSLQLPTPKIKYLGEDLYMIDGFLTLPPWAHNWAEVGRYADRNKFLHSTWVEYIRKSAGSSVFHVEVDNDGSYKQIGWDPLGWVPKWLDGPCEITICIIPTQDEATGTGGYGHAWIRYRHLESGQLFSASQWFGTASIRWNLDEEVRRNNPTISRTRRVFRPRIWNKVWPNCASYAKAVWCDSTKEVFCPNLPPMMVLDRVAMSSLFQRLDSSWTLMGAADTPIGLTPAELGIAIWKQNGYRNHGGGF